MISRFSVKKTYTVLVGVIMVIVLGIVSFTKMTTDLLPNINLPYVIVMTTYAGASPETVETVVTKPVESSMATVSNIEGISSVSSENYSMVVLEFAQSADMNSVSLEIRENLDQIKSFWDDSVGNPIIIKLNPDMLPVMIAAVGKEGATNAQISDLTQDKIIPELESIEGVASAGATGLIEESVHVIIRQDKIDRINQQVFGYIDSEMEEKEQELAEGKQEIEEGRSELLDTQKELEDSKREIEEGKADLEKGEKELADGKAELAQKKDEATGKLAEMETKLITAKTDLEAMKVNLNSQITMLEKLKDSLKDMAEDGKASLEEQLKKLDGQLAQLDETLIQIDAGIAQADEGIASIDKKTAAIDNTLSQASGFEDQSVEYLQSRVDEAGLDEETASGIKEVLNAYPNEMLVGDILAGLEEQKSGLEAQRAELEAQKSELEAQKVTLQEQRDSLQQMKDALTSPNPQLEALKAQIEAALEEMGYPIPTGTELESFLDDIIQEMKNGLRVVEENLVKVNAGLTQVYKGNLEAAAELSNAQTKIELGEFQMDLAKTQLEAGEKQLESGQEQIDTGLEQLEDALKQLKEGEEQLAEAKEDAYISADMTDILTVDTVKSLLTAQNFSMPGGYVTEEGIQYLVRIGDKPEEIGKLAAMPILNPDMEGVDIITLSDVADVFMTDNSADIYTNINGSPGILLTIQKQTGYSTGDVSDKLKDKFAALAQEDEGLTILTLMDQGIYIEMVMDSIINNVLFGAVLAIFILIIFLKDLRPTLVIACSIPVSLIAAIVCMYFSGVTLNIISLSGLALGVGMLVDNSIVVIENIYRLRSEGKGIREAAIEGAGEVADAIMASTLTTVCVFAPIVFTEGITRQLFLDMGLTIAYSLLASLLIALTVVPAMASKMLTKTKEQKDDKFFSSLIKGYEKALRLSLRFKPVVLIGVLVLLAVSIAAAFSRGTAFMPSMESTQVTVTVHMPEGTPLSETGEVTDEILERIRTIEDVEDVGAMASASSMSMLTGGGNSSTNATEIYITLSEDKTLTGDQLAALIKEKTADIEEAELVINTSSMDMSALGGSGISIQVRGRELDTLQDIAKDIAAIVEGTEGTTEVSDGLEDATEELRIIIDRDKAIEHGLTVAQVFQQIASKLASASSATTFETDIKEYDVYVKSANDIALTRETVKALDIDVNKKNGTKEKVALTDIASFETKESPSSVNRSDQNRYIGVTAAIAEGYNVGLVSQDLQKSLDSYDMPEGYSLRMSGENETIKDAMGQVTLMMILAVTLMYLIMVAQFQSLLSPFIIMFTIPLAFTGGFLGLYVSGSEVSVIALIGFVMLAGIIVNNGIVLVDYINQLRASGTDKKEAIVEAGRTRLRPVLMTALTTILALSTMVFSKDMGAEMSKPMAIVAIGGLIYGTLLTLLVVPCIYDIFMRDRKVSNRGKEEAEGE